MYSDEPGLFVGLQRRRQHRVGAGLTAHHHTHGLLQSAALAQLRHLRQTLRPCSQYDLVHQRGGINGPEGVGQHRLPLQRKQQLVAAAHAPGSPRRRYDHGTIGAAPIPQLPQPIK